MAAIKRVPWRRMRSMLLGLIALGLFAGSISLTGRFLSGDFEGGVPVNAVFSAPGVGQQLPVGGDVKVRGVLVGRIADIELGQDGNAIVEMALDADVLLPSDSRAEIRSKTVFGQKWVEIIPPKDGGNGSVLAGGSVIPDDRTLEPLELERALQLGHDLLGAIPNRDLSLVFRTLANAFEDSVVDAQGAIDDGLVALRAANANGADLDKSLRQLREFAEFLDDHDTDLLSFMDSLDRANRAIVTAAPAANASLRSVPKFLHRLTGFQERLEPDLSRLIKRGASLAQLLATHETDLVDLVMEIEPFTTVWNSGLKQPCSGLFESDMTCWQVYQAPGLDSRGLYGEGESPLDNDSADPVLPTLSESELGALKKMARSMAEGDLSEQESLDLAEVLLAPVIEGMPAAEDG